MTVTNAAFVALLQQAGSNVTFHREEGGTVCPCVSREGFRSPAWHKANPSVPVCNEEGRLAGVVKEYVVKAAVQPVRTSSRRVGERAVELFGIVQEDDHIGVFPATWGGHTLDFSDWSSAGEDYVVYNNRRFICVAADKFPDIDGDPDHHWECALRLMNPAREL